MKNKSILIMIAGVFALILIMAGLAAALDYKLICLSKGQKVVFAENTSDENDWICTGDSCNLCVSVTNGIYTPAAPNVCNSLKLKCTSFNKTGTDLKAPEITLFSPEDGKVYSSKSILLKIKLSELGKIKLIDLLNKGSTSSICSDCFEYARNKTFKEGQNNISILAIDLYGNNATKNISFLIDSTKPKIEKITPNTGFTNGNISIEIKEVNPKSIIFFYGLNNSIKSKSIELNNCKKSNTSNDKYLCNFQIDLTEYNNKSIIYWANITDIAGNKGSFKQIKIVADTQSPKISLFSHTIQSGKLNMSMKVEDDRFDSVKYIDNSATSPKWTTACSSLSKGFCTKSISLSAGTHNLSFRVFDKAGNFVTESITETV